MPKSFMAFRPRTCTLFFRLSFLYSRIIFLPPFPWLAEGCTIALTRQSRLTYCGGREFGLTIECSTKGGKASDFSTRKKRVEKHSLRKSDLSCELKKQSYANKIRKGAEPAGQPPCDASPKKVHAPKGSPLFQKSPGRKVRKIGSVGLMRKCSAILILRPLLTALAVIAADTLPQFSAFFFGHTAVGRRRKL